jgi:hypothetical protein
MAYYTRVLSKRDECPSFDELARIAASHPNIGLSPQQGNAGSWNSLLLSYSDGEPIAAIERNVVADGSLGEGEVAEFIDELRQCRPPNAARWVVSFLRTVKVIYAFQHLDGSFEDERFAALQAIKTAIWGRGEAILQAHREGFSNEEGYHIIWQFSDDASGLWWMAVRHEPGWACFEMDLGNREHRQAFLEGRVPPGTAVKLIPAR